MSQFVIEELGSDSSDDDYRPEADSVSECESDIDKFDNEDDDECCKIKDKGKFTSRKRKGGIKLEINKADEVKEELKTEIINKAPDFEGEKRLQEVVKKEEAKKSRADDLWSDFMKSTNTKPKLKVLPTQQIASPAKTSTSKSNIVTSNKMVDLFAGTTAADKPKTKTIEVEYDFAGEAVKISKEIIVDSKEDLKYSAPKRSGGLGSLLDKLSKKPKIGTLGKSKLDWNSFKEKEGLVEEMSTHNKGKKGYIERKNFLERTDHRQFEKEKDFRLSSRKAH